MSMSHTCEWVTHVNESHIPMSHKCQWVTHVNELHMWMSHTFQWVTHVNESHMLMSHTCEWVTHVNQSHMSMSDTCQWVTHAWQWVTHVNKLLYSSASVYLSVYLCFAVAVLLAVAVCTWVRVVVLSFLFLNSHPYNILSPLSSQHMALNRVSRCSLCAVSHAFIRHFFFYVCRVSCIYMPHDTCDMTNAYSWHDPSVCAAYRERRSSRCHAKVGWRV